MKKRTKFIAAVAASLALMFTLTACSGPSSLDVVGRQSVTSFDEVLKTIPDQVKTDELNVGWSLSAPDDSVRFIWSEDYSKAPLHDVMLELDAQPFIDAGLVPDKLPDNYAFYKDDTMGSMGSEMLMVGTKLGSDKLTYSGSPTALAAYEQIVTKYRDSINYHASLDHYGVKLGDGNMFEWAKDMKINGYDNTDQDKDIVFVLNPEPLIAAGVDPEKVEGWAYAQVPIEENGKTEQVWKLLKPFNLK
ncbi:hypothetical protein [Stenoxybacter acetivorans]|uniref:hypothetical protein n=1 Tax=Stenoxybacter acetivorans TaxID=422441 RepID=UPI000564F63F|nr:hypothetical protein [Stenoxybacter acetivorans]